MCQWPEHVANNRRYGSIRSSTRVEATNLERSRTDALVTADVETCELVIPRTLRGPKKSATFILTFTPSWRASTGGCAPRSANLDVTQDIGRAK